MYRRVLSLVKRVACLPALTCQDPLRRHDVSFHLRCVYGLIFAETLTLSYRVFS
ncbi:hypothetical protein AC520_2671 [Enterobacter sp. OLF]|nr:hypothetical protein AC520_2671 [Enterobacter sp. OLF]